MNHPTRRDALRAGAVGAASLLAGCVSGDGGPETDQSTSETTAEPTHGTTGPTDTTTTEPPTETTPASYPGVSVESLTARESIVYPLLDTLDVSGEGRQYVFATVEAGESVPDPEEFELALDGGTTATGETHLGTMSPSGPTPRVEGLGTALAERDRTGWVGFELPATVENGAGAVRLPAAGEAWPLPASAAAELAAPAPAFEQDVLAIETHGDGEFTVRAAVHNAGDRRETFRGCVNVAVARTRPFAVAVPPGESREWTWTHTWSGEGEAEVTVRTVRGEASERVA